MRVRTPTTLVMAYYENPGMLAEHFRLLASYPEELRAGISLVVVDDGSPTYPATPPFSDLGVPLQMYRIKKDVRWNQDAARNIGVLHAQTDWVLMTDMDHIVPRGTWSALLGRQWDEATAYSFSRVTAVRSDDLTSEQNTEYKHHPNSWFMSKKLFERVGGYDERFAGYYGTDADFSVRLAGVAAERTRLKEYLIRVPREVIPDASTTTYKRKMDYDRPAIVRLTDQRKIAGGQPMRYRFEYERVL